MNNKFITAVFLLIGSFLATVNYAHAKDAEPDKFRIAVGGYSIFRADSALSLTEPNLGVGVSINPSDTFGLDAEQSVARLDGHFRFNERHSLTFSWYSISSDGNKTLDEEINWVDRDGNETDIPLGTRVDTNFKYDIFKVGYLWSFYHSDKVELGVGGGLHITQVKLGIDAETTSSGIGAEDVAVTVPLPVLSLAFKYNVTPRISWYVRSEVFAIAFDTWEGTYTDNTLGFEYRVWRHIGLGVGLGSNALKVTEEADAYTFNYDNRLSGLMFFLSGYF